MEPGSAVSQQNFNKKETSEITVGNEAWENLASLSIVRPRLCVWNLEEPL